VVEARWYIVHVAAGSERQVVAEMKKKFEKEELSDLLEEVLVFSKEAESVRRGARVKVQEKIFPGYVFVKMRFSPQSFTMIKSLPKVLDFLGATVQGVPQPLADEEVKKLIGQVEKLSESLRVQSCFEIGQIVRVRDGLFAGMEGVVENVDVPKQRLKVSIDILGRPTPVELEFSQVE